MAKDDDELEEDSSEVEDINGETIDLKAGPNADDRAVVEKYISKGVLDRYEVHSYRHAAAILANTFPSELKDIEDALLGFSITKRDIGTPGGNESVMPKKFSYALRPKNWVETRIQGDLLVKLQEYEERIVKGRLEKLKRPPQQPTVISNFIDGHKIDYVKGKVAFDFEWNSKDQTFDRDLYALRAFHDCGLVSVGVLVTRSADLNPVFEKVPRYDKSGNIKKASVKSKYGASTTWMGKLLYRLNAGRHGGCPVLVFGITRKLISDWKE